MHRRQKEGACWVAECGEFFDLCGWPLVRTNNAVQGIPFLVAFFSLGWLPLGGWGLVGVQVEVVFGACKASSLVAAQGLLALADG